MLRNSHVVVEEGRATPSNVARGHRVAPERAGLLEAAAGHPHEEVLRGYGVSGAPAYVRETTWKGCERANTKHLAAWAEQVASPAIS